MIRVRQAYSPAATVAYLTGSRSYSHPNATPDQGHWAGSLTAMAGPSTRPGDPVAPTPFHNVLDGFNGQRTHPIIGYRQTVHRCAYDFTASASKSVSVAALCVPEIAQPVRSAFNDAILALIAFLESFAAHRRTSRAERSLRGQSVRTGTACIAHFTHEASRWNDPHLHSHITVINSTFNPSLRRLLAIDAKPMVSTIMRNSGANSLFNHELNRCLHAGAIRSRIAPDGTCHIPAVPISLSQRLSQGHRAVSTAMQDATPISLGLPQHTPKTKLDDLLGDRIRPPKSPRDFLWPDLLKPRQRAAIAAAAIAAPPPPPPSPLTPSAITSAIIAQHLADHRYISTSTIIKAATTFIAQHPSLPLTHIIEPIHALIENPSLIANRRQPPQEVIDQILSTQRYLGINSFIEAQDKANAERRRALNQFVNRNIPKIHNRTPAPPHSIRL